MTLDELLAERAIYRQLVGFARAMDNRDWDAIRAITAPDIEANMGTGDIHGSDAVVQLIRQYLDNCGTTQHILGNILIEVDGDTASSQAYVSDMHLAKGDGGEHTFRTLGNYSDQWQRVNGQWLMTRRIKDNRASLGSMEVFKP